MEHASRSWSLFSPPVVLVLAAGLAFSQGEPKPADNPDLLFACSFDGTLAPAVHKGEGTPKEAGAVEYTKGFMGQALVTAHNQGVSFPLKGNLDVAAGTIKLWVMPLDWSVGDNLFHHFFRIAGPPADNKNARVFDLILYKFWEWDTVVAYGMANEIVGPNLLQLPMDRMWAPKKWHQVVFAWDQDGAALYVDGAGKRQRYLKGAPDTLTADSFTLGGPYFAANKTRTAIDELAIYSRRLSDQEVEMMYRTELIESVMPRQP